MTGSIIPERLIERLDDLGAVLAQRGDAVAVDRVLTIAGLRPGAAGQQDVFAVERGAEQRFGTGVPLAAMVPGYGRNCEAALAILVWLEAHADVEPTLAAAIREVT